MVLGEVEAYMDSGPRDVKEPASVLLAGRKPLLCQMRLNIHLGGSWVTYIIYEWRSNRYRMS